MNAFEIERKRGNLINALDLLDLAFANLSAVSSGLKFKLVITAESEINPTYPGAPIVIQCDFQSLQYRLQPFHFTYGDIKALVENGIFSMAGETNYVFKLEVIGDKFDI